MSDVDALIAEAELHRRRTIMGIHTDCETATITIRLGCGHDLTFQIADHSVKRIDHSLRIGDELECDICDKPAIH